jgi:hypothetical protein
MSGGARSSPTQSAFDKPPLGDPGPAFAPLRTGEIVFLGALVYGAYLAWSFPEVVEDNDCLTDSHFVSNYLSGAKLRPERLFGSLRATRLLQLPLLHAPALCGGAARPAVGLRPRRELQPGRPSSSPLPPSPWPGSPHFHGVPKLARMHILGSGSAGKGARLASGERPVLPF